MASHLHKGGRVRSPFVPYTMDLTRGSVTGRVPVDVRFKVTEDTVVWIVGRDDQGWRRVHCRGE